MIPLGVLGSAHPRAVVPASGMYLGATDSTPVYGAKINVSMPAAVNTGDLLIIQLVNASNSTPSTPSGWTSLVTTASSTVIRQTLFHRVADGTEGGSTVEISVPGPPVMNAVCHRFAAGTYGAFGATGASGNDTNPNPPSRTSGLGAVPTFWMALCAYYGDFAVSSYPLAENRHNLVMSGMSTNRSLASCSEVNSLAAFDPPAFAIPSAARWVAHTLSVEVL